MDPLVETWSANGILKFRAVLTMPPDKNDRYAPNCIRAEKGGRLYYKPGAGLWKLSPAALKWRADLEMRCHFPRKPYFISGIPWMFQVEHFGPGDADHYIHGLIDDVCSAGLAKSDKNLIWYSPPVLNREHTGEPYVEVFAAQEIPNG